MALIPRKEKGRPTKKPDDETLAALYAEKTAREIGEMYGVKPSTVRTWAHRVRVAQEAREAQGARADG